MSNLGLLVLVLGFQSVDVLNAGAPEANERCLMRDGHPGRALWERRGGGGRLGGWRSPQYANFVEPGIGVQLGHLRYYM